MANRTLAIIKPDAIKNGHTGKIYDRILNAKFRILGARLIQMTLGQAEGFYAAHTEKPFYAELTTSNSAYASDNSSAINRDTITSKLASPI